MSEFLFQPDPSDSTNANDLLEDPQRDHFPYLGLKLDCCKINEYWEDVTVVIRCDLYDLPHYVLPKRTFGVGVIRPTRRKTSV